MLIKYGAKRLKIVHPLPNSGSSASPAAANDGSPQGSQSKNRSSSPGTPNWTIIECEDDGAGFDLGGWLAIKDNRFLCEMGGRIYIISLTNDRDIYLTKPSWSLSTASSSELKVPVSFMSLYDDCIMSTYSVSTSKLTRLVYLVTDCVMPRPLVGTLRSKM